MFERTELVPKGLLIAVLIGLVSGPIAGAILYLQDDNQQLIFVEGPSVSIVTEKIDFKLKEEIVIKIVNSGTVPLTFNDASYGLRVTGLDGILYYTPVAAQVVSELEPRDEITFVWDQQKLDGSYSLEGRYKITTEGFDPENNKVKKSIVINVLK